MLRSRWHLVEYAVSTCSSSACSSAKVTPTEASCRSPCTCARPCMHQHACYVHAPTNAPYTPPLCACGCGCVNFAGGAAAAGGGAHGVAGLQQLPRECLGLGGARQRRRRQQQRQQPARRADRMRVPAACVHVRVTRQRLWQVRWDNVLRMCVRERATQASQQEPLVHA